MPLCAICDLIETDWLEGKGCGANFLWPHADPSLGMYAWTLTRLKAKTMSSIALMPSARDPTQPERTKGPGTERTEPAGETRRTKCDGPAEVGDKPNWSRRPVHLTLITITAVVDVPPPRRPRHQAPAAVARIAAHVESASPLWHKAC